VLDWVLTLMLVVGYIVPWVLYIREVGQSRHELRLLSDRIDNLADAIDDLDGDDPDPDEPDEDRPELITDNVVVISRRAA
jgi:hypothetical protein